MVDTLVERNAIISGIGKSRIGRKTGIGHADLTVESCVAAIVDAGLTPADIDGVATIGDTPIPEAVARLGIKPAWTGGGYLGHFGLLTPVMEAAGAVGSGTARHVLVYRTVNMLGGSMTQPRPEGAQMRVPESMADMRRVLTMHAYAAPNWVAMHLRRHMHLYGTTRQQLGWLAINSRRNAALNPDAAYRDPLSMEEFLSAWVISDPLGLYDCDVPVDGSIAVVLSTAGFAEDCDHPVRIESVGGSEGLGGWDQRPDYPCMASVDAAAELWSATDLVPDDIDVAELYDGFTFLTLAWLEALGFCEKGEGGPFLAGGTRIALDGQLPLNTYGGQLSAGRMHGYWVLHEACLQLRGEAGHRQVPGHPEVGVVSNGGGPIAGCMLLTR